MSALNRAALIGFVLCSASPVSAQLSAPVKNGDNSIVVTGTKSGKSRRQVEMSDWKMAETAHVVVFAKGDEKALVRTADNLEKLHFLLSMLLDRVDKPDDTIKIAVTLIGDATDFEQLRLTNLRWQNGPFPDLFPATVYYDPREEGSVMATTATGVKLIFEQSQGRPTNRNCDAEGDELGWSNNGVPAPSAGDSQSPTASSGGIDLSQITAGEQSVCQSPDARLYSAFAQNYLMTYFPAAYPRWYVQGFGEMFTTVTTGPGVIEYGRRPIGFQQVMERYGNYPVTGIFSGAYLGERRWPHPWTPYHAWRLVHLLFFSKEWKAPLHNFLKASADGAEPEIAAHALGDPKVLQKAVSSYRGRKIPFERLSFSPDRIAPPVVRQLTRAEAGLVRGRLELGARVELPAEGSPDLPRALARREAWLARLRHNATKFPNLIENQLLLAEGECRSGNAEACLQAAERALAIGPSDTTGLVWKGTAMLQLAARAPASERASRIKAARAVIAKANRADPDALLPLIAYSNSYAAVGQRAPDVAVDALFSIVDSAPAAPKPRLMLGEELVRRDLDAEARKALLPVAKGPFDSPEKPRAQKILPQPASRPQL